METMSMMLLEHTGGIYHPPKSRFFLQDNRDPKVFCAMFDVTFNNTNHSIYLFPHDFSRLWICLQLFSLPWMTAALVLGSARLSIFFFLCRTGTTGRPARSHLFFTVSLCHVLCFVLHKHWETPYERSKPPTVSLAQEGSKLWTRT